jgi:glycosyltransferase involved in cell wall biosynthesis
MNPLVSIVIRTLNEERYLGELLDGLKNQALDVIDLELIVVDSGSTDRTLNIAADFGAKIVHIRKEDFSFGRSLNVGCMASKGSVLVFVSGHCVPIDSRWINELVKPIFDGSVSYTYGRQEGRDTTKYSETKVFEKYFPVKSYIPQEGYFCNNANAAIDRDVWSEYQFDEELTGLEDMELAKRIYQDGKSIGYVAEAGVYHIHNEKWGQVKNRYEREAIALQNIMPEIHVSFIDFVRYVSVSIFSDLISSKNEIFHLFFEIVSFRFLQFWGGFKGNHSHRKLSANMKRKYFYPTQEVTSIKRNTDA